MGMDMVQFLQSAMLTASKNSATLDLAGDDVYWGLLSNLHG